MSETSSNVLSIQGEQQGTGEEEIYLNFGGPNVKVAIGKLATRKSTQRFVIDARAVSDSFSERADGEERHTRKFAVVAIEEFGAITEPEEPDDDPSLFDDASEG